MPLLASTGDSAAVAIRYGRYTATCKPEALWSLADHRINLKFMRFQAPFQLGTALHLANIWCPNKVSKTLKTAPGFVVIFVLRWLGFFHTRVEIESPDPSVDIQSRNPSQEMLYSVPTKSKYGVNLLVEMLADL